MLIAFLFLGACLVGLGIRSVVDTVRSLPRSNEDWVWY
ncbi:hypothetical protein SAMN05444679_10928 [Variovorax sp. CF079]|nr:hypothetical protein SAMN05444679_10928 [Variovorax sp. CF079]